MEIRMIRIPRPDPSGEIIGGAYASFRDTGPGSRQFCWCAVGYLAEILNVSHHSRLRGTLGAIDEPMERLVAKATGATIEEVRDLRQTSDRLREIVLSTYPTDTESTDDDLEGTAFDVMGHQPLLDFVDKASLIAWE